MSFMSQDGVFIIDENTCGPPPVRDPPFQFTLGSLLIVSTVFAVLCSLIFSGYAWVCLLTMTFLGVLAPMVLTVGLIYGRGKTRTFCIGALFPAGVVMCLDVFYLFYLLLEPRSIWLMMELDERVARDTAPYLFFTVMGALALIVAAGPVALGVRWMVESGRR
jgi:hypothetical protein